MTAPALESVVFEHRPSSALDIIARIMAQADANGPCGPKRGAIHKSEYESVFRYTLHCKMLAGRPFAPTDCGGRGLAVWSMNGPVTLFHAEDVPAGAIRWEPSE